MIITIPRVNAVATIFLSFVFSGFGVNESVSPLLASEPEENSITERVPRTIRLYFKSLPDVDQSNISLIGPSGDYTLRGLHTMGEDDLMVEIYKPMLVDGEYRVEWEAQFTDGRVGASGEYNFSIRVSP